MALYFDTSVHLPQSQSLVVQANLRQEIDVELPLLLDEWDGKMNMYVLVIEKDVKMRKLQGVVGKFLPHHSLRIQHARPQGGEGEITSAQLFGTGIIFCRFCLQNYSMSSRVEPHPVKAFCDSTSRLLVTF